MSHDEELDFEPVSALASLMTVDRTPPKVAAEAALSTLLLAQGIPPWMPPGTRLKPKRPGRCDHCGKKPYACHCGSELAGDRDQAGLELVPELADGVAGERAGGDPVEAGVQARDDRADPGLE
jgi:hypothetical protein